MSASLDGQLDLQVVLREQNEYSDRNFELYQ
jgi:hypothetical protein